MNKRLGRLLNTQVWVYFVLMCGFVLGAFLLRQYFLAGIETLVLVVVFLVYIGQKRSLRRELQHFLSKVTDRQTGAENAESPFPTAVIRVVDGAILTANELFAQATGYTEGLHEVVITDLIPGFSTEWLISGKNEYAYDVTILNRRYRVYGTIVRADDPNKTVLGVLRFSDLTELYQVRDEYIRSRPVVSMILIDNYEELTKNMTEGAISSLDAKINDCITRWSEGYHGLLRRMEKNRFLFIFEKRDMKEAEEEKFSLLEDIHGITNPSGLATSISFGLGVDGATYEESFKFASLAIEMALSRGGDQAVIKDRYNFSFYGGRTKETDRRSKVRSRVTANSLMELIGQSSQVFVMGHKNADLDAVGAAMGICCMCRKKGKKVSIVLDLNNNSAERLIEEIRAVPEYQDVFVSSQDALLLCDNGSILVVVDTNRPDQVEDLHLLEAISKVCVLDHHRRAADYINPVVVNLHEPYASSASELATELLQYAVEKM
ncbi:MAG: DHH family phosphoesterase, partial [Oscillospiraceae bacterium]|nr:DHH family phosphoesterase [Oscillospiraceae bacterium]